VVRLEVAVDHAVAVREAGRLEDLQAEVDHALLGERCLGGDDVLECLPLQELHRDVVGALVLAAVEDADHVRVVQAGGGRCLAEEALDELLIRREAAMEHLERDLPAEVGVLGAVHVGHSARTDAPKDPVAVVDARVPRHLGHPPPPFRSASSTYFAIGAATVPPWPLAFGIVTATAIRGASTGAKQMNHAWVNSALGPVSAVPVLPATVTPSSAAAVPVPSSTTRLIISPSWWAVSGFITTDWRSGWIRSSPRPPFCTMRSTSRGFISRPSFATVAATSAIW